MVLIDWNEVVRAEGGKPFICPAVLFEMSVKLVGGDSSALYS